MSSISFFISSVKNCMIILFQQVVTFSLIIVFQSKPWGINAYIRTIGSNIHLCKTHYNVKVQENAWLKCMSSRNFCKNILNFAYSIIYWFSCIDNDTYIYIYIYIYHIFKIWICNCWFSNDMQIKKTLISLNKVDDDIWILCFYF